MANKLASVEPNSSRSPAETEKRSEDPKTQLGANPSWWRLVLEVPLMGVILSGEPQIKASYLPLKQTLSCSARSHASQVAPHARRSGHH